MLIDVQFDIDILAHPGIFEDEVMVQAPTFVEGCHCNILYSEDIPEALDYALLPEAPGTPTRVYAGPLADGVFQGFLWWPTEEQALADLTEAGWTNPNPTEEVA